MSFPLSASFFRFIPPKIGTPNTDSPRMSVKKKMMID